MPPEAHAPGSPADWLRHAYSDLALASTTPLPQILLEQLCFHAQQAAEKALKAILVAYNVSVPRTHNLRTLFDLLPADVPVPPDIQEAAGLSDYAVASRYPGISEPVEAEEYREAVDLAEVVVYWAERVISLRSLDPSYPTDPL
ncbi:MAG: HEPN domain-containing protein [Chloroflexi bacterium]|nr:HEPN domain-containing protein [Chloroflexota bacterium]